LKLEQKKCLTNLQKRDDYSTHHCSARIPPSDMFRSPAVARLWLGWETCHNVVGYRPRQPGATGHNRREDFAVGLARARRMVENGRVIFLRNYAPTCGDGKTGSPLSRWCHVGEIRNVADEKSEDAPRVRAVLRRRRHGTVS
ncbi:MAG TPA: hypothetical protein VKU82_08530, partial [Planctomycetaceae bacterium]|nr:hypothetical protein [Planctomycetaceae bacterium]